MTRRPNARLTDADIGRLLAHMPAPPPPSADLADRIVANAIAATATRPRRSPRRFGRRIWWAIAILGAAGAVTAAAANAGRFEFARVLQWPQEIARAAGWAPHHPRSLLVRAERATTPRPETPAFVPPLAAGPRPLAPLAVGRGERLATTATPHPPRFAGADQTASRPPRALTGVRTEARIADERRIAAAPLAVAAMDRAADHAGSVARPSMTAEPTPAPATRDDLDQAAKDDALRFHDADEYARRQTAADHDWRSRDNAAPRALAADAADRRWAADRGDDRWSRPQGWQRRADNRPFHPFRLHAPRGRRRG